MDTIRFVSDDPRQRQFAAALRKNVHEYFKSRALSTKGNVSLYIKTLVLLGIYIAPFVLVLTLPVSAGWAVLLMVVMGIGMAGIGMAVMHDAVHGSYSTKKWVNDLVGGSIYLLGSSTSTWAIQHNFLHHTYTNISGYDEDIETKGVHFIRLSKHAPWRRHQRYQHIYTFFFYGFMTLSKLAGDFTQLKVYNKAGITELRKENPRKEMIRMVISKTAYLLVIIGLPLWLTDFSWWQILLGFLIMQMTGGIIMSTIFQMAHVVENTQQPLPDEHGIIHNEWVVHELQTTSDFAPRSSWLSWYSGGLNYQVEHHLFPSICHVHYPRIAPIVQQTAKEFGIGYHVNPTFLSALRSHLRTLRRLGKAPDKDYVLPAGKFSFRQKNIPAVS